MYQVEQGLATGKPDDDLKQATSTFIEEWETVSLSVLVIQIQRSRWFFLFFRLDFSWLMEMSG